MARTTLRTFVKFGGNKQELAHRPPGTTLADHAFRILRETARQAEHDDNLVRAGAIRKALDALDKRAIEELQGLTLKYGRAAAPPTQGDAATAGDDRTDSDRRSHSTAGPHSHSIRLAHRLQAVVRR